MRFRPPAFDLRMQVIVVGGKDQCECLFRAWGRGHGEAGKGVWEWDGRDIEGGCIELAWKLLRHYRLFVALEVTIQGGLDVDYWHKAWGLSLAV